MPHSSHWGALEAEVADGTVVAIRPYRHDPDPSPLLGNIVDSLRHRARITQPMIRAGWLDRGPGPDARRSIGRTHAVPSAPSPPDAGGRTGAAPAGPSLTPGIACFTGAKASVSPADIPLGPVNVT